MTYYFQALYIFAGWIAKHVKTLGEKKYFTYFQSYVLNGNLFQLLNQVIMITGAASFVSECGRGWMLLVLRGEGEEATV